MEPLYIFIHLAKTGGTTFTGHLYKHMEYDEEIIHLGTDIPMKKPLEERSSAELDKIKVISGHLARWGVHKLFPNREPRYIIFLREPVSRVISHYTFDTSKRDQPFDKWYNNVWIKNQMYYFLLDHFGVTDLFAVLEILQKFWHIGLTEQLDDSLKFIFGELGVPLDYQNRRVAGERKNSTADLGYDQDRVVKKTYMPTDAELERIKKDHILSSWMYEHIKDSLHDDKYIPDKINPPVRW